MTTTALSSRIDASIDDIAPTLTTEQRAMIAPILARYGEPLLRRCAKAGIRLAVISGPYHEASRALADYKHAGSIDVDAWPIPPSGLFVVAERTAYIRHVTAVTIAHEFGHAIDCALGDGTYASGRRDDIRLPFKRGDIRFINRYAASGLDEYFAEGLRAMIDIDDPSINLPASPFRLAAYDPNLFTILSTLLNTGELPCATNAA